jgi:hypothetical protein
VAGHDPGMFARPRDLEPIRDDLSLLLVSNMRIQATLEEIRRFLLGDDDGEDEGERADS